LKSAKKPVSRLHRVTWCRPDYDSLPPRSLGVILDSVTITGIIFALIATYLIARHHVIRSEYEKISPHNLSRFTGRIMIVFNFSLVSLRRYSKEILR
jgi:hypothetical protein